MQTKNKSFLLPRHHIDFQQNGLSKLEVGFSSSEDTGVSSYLKDLDLD